MASQTDAFERLLEIATSPANADERRALSFVAPPLREQFSMAAAGVIAATGSKREELDAELAVLLSARLVWSVVPAPLFRTADPDYEELAHGAFFRRFGKAPTTAAARMLATVFRRLRAAMVDGREASTLDLGRSKHRALMEQQKWRCALCGFQFPESIGDYADEESESFWKEEYLPQEGEVCLERYHRRPVLDHIIPYFLGGDGAENWQILCVSCNAGKGESLAWLARKGWMPPARPREVMRLSASLRYACLADYRARPANGDSVVVPGELRLFLRDPGRMVVFDNIDVRRVPSM